MLGTHMGIHYSTEKENYVIYFPGSLLKLVGDYAVAFECILLIIIHYKCRHELGAACCIKLLKGFIAFKKQGNIFRWAVKQISKLN